MSQIEKGIKNEIFKKIAKTVDEYLSADMNVKVSHLKKYFNNPSNLKMLIKDINEVGLSQFEDKDEYKKYIKKVLTDVLVDREAFDRDKNPKKIKNKKVESYNGFLNQNIIK